MSFRVLTLLVLLAGCHGDVSDVEPLRLTVMSFNVWGAGSNDGKSSDATLAVIRAVDPDIIGLLEVRAEAIPCTSICPPAGPSRAPEIARALGYFLYEQEQQNVALWAGAILSRYPITRSTENDLGVVIDVSGRPVAMFTVHLTDYPYQPYQLLGIPYDDAPFLHSEAGAIEAAKTARGPGLELLMSDLESVANVDVVFITGDFNEPSHRDWTKRAAQMGRHPIKVQYPTALRLEELGFVDTYRAMFPDEIEKPGLTWATTTTVDDKDDHHDRVDYVFMRAAGGEIESAAVVGEKTPDADIVISPWPSDHRAVVVSVSIP